MKQVKVNAWKIEGCAVTVTIKGSIEEYAKNFLHIFNNVRENKELLKVENHYSNNDVTVYCEPEFKDATIKYLENFGEIKECEKVLMYQMEEPDFDLDEYEDIIVVPTFE